MGYRDPASIDDPCTLCGKAPATTTYGYPVCQPCHDWLVDIDGHLAEMEADDPVLRELGKQIEQAWREDQ